MRRTSVSSEENLEGKFFIQFTALIFLSYIHKAMEDHTLYKHYTLQEALDELDILERLEQPGHQARFSEITKKQEHLYECMGVSLPT